MSEFNQSDSAMDEMNRYRQDEEVNQTEYEEVDEDSGAEDSDEEEDIEDGDEDEEEATNDPSIEPGNRKPKPKANNGNTTNNPITHESNDSTRRRRKRSQVSKLKNRVIKKRRGRDEVNLDFSGEFDYRSPTEEVEGYIHVVEQGYAFIRNAKNSFLAQDLDPVIPKELAQRFYLRSGHRIRAIMRTKRNRRQKVIVHIQTIQGVPAKEWRNPANFHTLTSVNPFEFFKLSTPQDTDKSMAIMELLTPIGKGQRGLLVAPPRSGKTMLMEKIANGISVNHPDAEIMLLLVDERPEEVTHLTRKVKGKVWASCLDRPNDEHVAMCQMVIDMAMRKVESGKDVIILLDSITRMARAFNNQLKSSGRTLSGGVDAKAMQEPKRFFGAARKLEEAGSLTIIATALVQTGSQMDEVIFQEFKGTGNMELVLNRKLAERRIYPAIDIGLSGTRREELILPPEYHKAAIKFRRYLNGLTEANQIQAAIQAMEKFKSTEEFITAFV